MCKALDDLYQEGVEKGIEKGIEKGRAEMLRDFVFRKIQKGNTIEEIADMLEESVDVVKEIAKQ